MYEQQVDSRGYLVYKNRYNGKTEQDNPNLVYILLTINEKYAASRYSTYRCAGKLYALQKALYTSCIPFEMVGSILDRHQLNVTGSAPSIKPSQLIAVVHDIYFAASRMGFFEDLACPPNLDVASALLAGFFWAVFDPRRNTPMSALELRQTFLLLCDHSSHTQLVWEHFRLCNDHNLCVSRHRFEAMLTVLSKVLTFLGEPDHLRPAMVQQIACECFANYPGLVGLTEYQFACLWKLSSLFSYYANVVSLNKRLRDTEHITHRSLCYGCRSAIRGLRFKCQRCRNVSLCIECFTHGFSNKRHNMAHKMYEISGCNDVDESHCSRWFSSLWQWIKASGRPAPSTYENLDAKLIDTKAVELTQENSAGGGEGGSVPHDNQTKELTLVGTLSRATNSTMKRNLSLFSSVEYSVFNNTQQKQLITKLASVSETLEERHEHYRGRLIECWTALSGDEHKAMNPIHQLFEEYFKHLGDSLQLLKDISVQMGQGLPQCSSTPYRNVVNNSSASESARSKPATDANRSYIGSSRLEKTDLSVRDISTWFHMDMPAMNGATAVIAPQADEVVEKGDTQTTVGQIDGEDSRTKQPIISAVEDELSYRIDRLKVDTQMANFRDLLLKVREIVDDSYSDNTELAFSTQLIEKALDRIIAQEELKRTQQLA